MKTLDRPTFIIVIAAIALALLWTAAHITPVSGAGYVAASIVLMAGYLVAQYRYSKSYR